MATYAEILEQARAEVRLVSLEKIQQRLEQRVPMVLVDVRETHELSGGFLPGAVSVPRGSLELEIEARVPDKQASLVVYCASGTRSLLAAKTLMGMGYERVESASPGFARWLELGFPIQAGADLTAAQRLRYARHLLLAEVGEVGQVKLLRSRILLLGAGGLGSPAALYLAAAGVGTLGLVDADVVDASNLQRQVIHSTSRVGMSKVESAARSIGELNPEVKVIQFEERLTAANVDRIFEGFDLVVDGCDNFPTRYLVSDASVFHQKPVVHGSLHRFEGQVSTFVPGSGGPCYRCLYPSPPPPRLATSCAEVGVLGVLPGVVGLLQATEVIKLVLGQGDLLNGRVLTYDALRMRFAELKIVRDKACPACGDHPTIKSYVDYEGFCNAG